MLRLKKKKFWNTIGQGGSVLFQQILTSRVIFRYQNGNIAKSEHVSYTVCSVKIGTLDSLLRTLFKKPVCGGSETSLNTVVHQQIKDSE